MLQALQITCMRRSLVLYGQWKHIPFLMIFDTYVVIRLLLLGYVGVPLVESIPCFIITSLAATRIAKMRKLEMKNRHRPHSNSVATQSVPSASSSIPSPVPSQGQVPFHTSDSNLYLESPSAARFHVTIRSDVKSNHLSDSPTWETSFPQSPVVLSLTDCVDEINESQQSSHTVHRGSNTVHVARENDPEDNASSFRSLAHSDGKCATHQRLAWLHTFLQKIRQV